MPANRTNQIERAELGPWLIYRTSDRRLDEREGRTDGSRGIPATQEQYNVPRRLIASARAALNGFNTAIDRYSNEQADQLEQLQNDRNRLFVERRQRLDEDYAVRVARLQGMTGPDSAEYGALKRDVDRATRRLREHEALLDGRPLRARFRRTYLVFMGLVALAEVPVNRLAFELFFEESPLLVMLLAATVGLILALFAHWIGVLLIRLSETAPLAVRVKNLVGLGLNNTLLGAVFYVLAKMREYYVSYLRSTSISFSELLRGDGGNRALDLADKLFDIPLSGPGWTLLVLNVLIISVGVGCSIARHDPDPDYEDLVRAKEKAQRRFDEHTQSYDKDLSDLNSHHHDSAGAIDRQVDRIDTEIGDVQAIIAECAVAKQAAVRTVVMVLQQRLLTYEDFNQRARTTKDTVTFFGAYDENSLEENLRNDDH